MWWSTSWLAEATLLNTSGRDDFARPRLKMWPAACWPWGAVIEGGTGWYIFFCDVHSTFVIDAHTRKYRLQFANIYPYMCNWCRCPHILIEYGNGQFAIDGCIMMHWNVSKIFPLKWPICFKNFQPCNMTPDAIQPIGCIWQPRKNPPCNRWNLISHWIPSNPMKRPDGWWSNPIKPHEIPMKPDDILIVDG